MLKRNGGDDGARTRDLRRDRPEVDRWPGYDELHELRTATEPI